MITIIFSIALILLLISMYVDTRNFQIDLLKKIETIETILKQKSIEKQNDHITNKSQEPPQE